jgi:hypothetical protein
MWSTRNWRRRAGVRGKRMSLPTLVAVGTPSSALGTVNPGLPAGIAVGDLCVMVVASAETDEGVPVAPTGWVYAGSGSGGGGTLGVGTGNRRLTYYTQQYSTTTFAPTVTLPGGVISSVIIGLRKASTEAWATTTAQFGAQTVSSTAWSAALAGVPSRMTTNAMVVVGYALAVAAAQSVSAEGLTATGATLGTVTERSDSGTTTGNAVALATATVAVSAGTATAAPTATATAAVASTGEVGALVVLATTAALSAQVDFKGYPQRMNHVSNPSAEGLATPPWLLYQTAGTGVLSVVHALEEGIGLSPTAVVVGTGPYAFKVLGASTNTSTNGIQAPLPTPIQENVVVTLSFDIFIPTGNPSSSVGVAFRSDLNATTWTTQTLSSSLSYGGWTRFKTTATVPAGSTLDRIYLYTTANSGTRGADAIYFDNVLVEAAAAPGATYFDGDTNANGLTYLWAGVPRLSESLQYAQPTNPRVGITLTNFSDVPTTVYRVTPNGARTAVRGGTVTPSGGSAFLWDYEYPSNTEIYYVASDNGTDRTTEFVDDVTIRRNGNSNPALYVDTTGWAAGIGGTGGAATVTRVTSGGPTIEGIVRNFLRFQMTTLGTATPTSVGAVYGSPSSTLIEANPGPFTASVWWRSSVTDRIMAIVVTFHDGAGTTLSTVQGASTEGGGLWTQATLSATAPAGTVRAFLRVYAQGTTPLLTLAETIDFTCLLTQTGGTQSVQYFDGNSRGKGFRWTGTGGVSPSEQYVADLPTPMVVTDTRAWLRSPGIPGQDVPVRVGAVPARAHVRPVNYLTPLGRRTPVPQAAARQSPSYPLTLVTLSDAEAAALITFMEGTAVAWVLHPNDRIHGTYASLSDLTETPDPHAMVDGVTQWSVTATEVSQPAGDVLFDASASWQAIEDNSVSWQAVLNTYPTWLAVLAGPGT